MGAVDKALRAVGAVRAVRAEGVWVHNDLSNPNQRQKAVSNGGSGVDKAHTQSAGGGGGGGGVGGDGGEGGGGGGGLGTQWGR